MTRTCVCMCVCVCVCVCVRVCVSTCLDARHCQIGRHHINQSSSDRRLTHRRNPRCSRLRLAPAVLGFFSERAAL
jgi:hypothetical protein